MEQLGLEALAQAEADTYIPMAFVCELICSITRTGLASGLAGRLGRPRQSVGAGPYVDQFLYLP
jgi:hypothetical protein